MPAVGAVISGLFACILGCFYAFCSAVLGLLTWNPFSNLLSELPNSSSFMLAMQFVNWICPLQYLATLLTMTVTVFGMAIIHQIMAKNLVKFPDTMAKTILDAVIPEVP